MVKVTGFHIVAMPSLIRNYPALHQGVLPHSHLCIVPLVTQSEFDRTDILTSLDFDQADILTSLDFSLKLP